MNLNWGKKIVLFFVCFVGLMAVMVWKSSQQNIDLVAVNYYERELAYQDQINRATHTNTLEDPLTFNIENGQLEVVFPKQSTNDRSHGKITFQRPSNKIHDLEFELLIHAPDKQILSLSLFQKGLYRGIIEWTTDEESYYTEKLVVIP
jgi:nitrogen fixation protein FixH